MILTSALTGTKLALCDTSKVGGVVEGTRVSNLVASTIFCLNATWSKCTNLLIWISYPVLFASLHKGDKPALSLVVTQGQPGDPGGKVAARWPWEEGGSPLTMVTCPWTAGQPTPSHSKRRRGPLSQARTCLPIRIVGLFNSSNAYPLASQKTASTFVKAVIPLLKAKNQIIKKIWK